MATDLWCPAVQPGGAALAVRLARAIVDDVTAGRLAAGERLPGARTLAPRLGVHRNTVAAAYQECVAQGWLVSTPRGGMRVTTGAAVASPPPSAPATACGFDLPESWAPPALEVTPAGVLTLAGGHPDLRLLPLAELGRAWRRVLSRGTRTPHHSSIVDYGDPRGHPALREALSDWLRRRRGLDVDAAGLMVTRGAQQAIGLAVLSTVRPGARVAVETLGYRPAWSAIRLAGAVPVPVPVDAEGMVVDALEALDVGAVYLTPHHQYPTMVALSPARRSALLAFAARRRIPVIEDDYDHEFHWASAPRLPLARADSTGQVLYVGTLSKALAPGLRIGFLVAPPQVIERAARFRTALDRQGDSVTERAVAELLTDGEIDRHIARMHKVYASRQQHTLALARGTLGVPIPAPDGGLALWARSPLDPTVLRAAAMARGVTFQIGSDHTFDGSADPHLRLGFANLDEAELTVAFDRLAAAIDDLGGLP